MIQKLDFKAIWWQKFYNGANVTNLHISVGWTFQHSHKIEQFGLA